MIHSPSTMTRVQHCLQTKVKAIAAAETGQKKSLVAARFDVKPSTLSTWLKQKDHILAEFHKNKPVPSRKRFRPPKYPAVDEAVYEWFKSARDKNLPISGPMLQAKAEVLAVKLGEGSAVREEHTSEWTSKDLPDLLQSYTQDDIFNADETGLFYRLLPERSLVLRGETCKGGKKSKERLTVLVAANMSGTQKLPLLVIGKSKSPRCFREVNTPPTEYTNNKKAWMTGAIFTEWLQKLDRIFTMQGRRVVMVVDNCTAHPHLTTLKSIKLVFLPPNTTSKTQPMDQGVIRNLKCHYRRAIL